MRFYTTSGQSPSVQSRLTGWQCFTQMYIRTRWRYCLPAWAAFVLQNHRRAVTAAILRDVPAVNTEQYPYYRSFVTNIVVDSWRLASKYYSMYIILWYDILYNITYIILYYIILYYIILYYIILYYIILYYIILYYTQPTKIQELRSNRTRVLLKIYTHYGPKHSWKHSEYKFSHHHAK